MHFVFTSQVGLVLPTFLCRMMLYPNGIGSKWSVLDWLCNSACGNVALHYVTILLCIMMLGHGLHSLGLCFVCIGKHMY